MMHSDNDDDDDDKNITDKILVFVTQIFEPFKLNFPIAN